MDTQSSSVWNGIGDALSGAANLYSTVKQIDLESSQQQFYDQQALLDQSTRQSSVAGFSVPTWAIAGALLLVVGAIAYKAIK